MYFICLYYNKILKFCNAENIIPLVTRLKDFKCCILKEQIGLLRSDQVKDLIQNEYSMKFHGWEITGEKDASGQIVTKVAMPEFPGLDKVLEAAEKMYNFVSSTSVAKK